jgi:hypothetical protein
MVKDLWLQAPKIIKQEFGTQKIRHASKFYAATQPQSPRYYGVERVYSTPQVKIELSSAGIPRLGN